MSSQMFWWIGFGVFVLVMLALDLGVFHRNAHEISLREALIWTGVWVGVAMLFNAALYFLQGREAALAFLTGYVIEKSLSVDNVFVFYLIFSSTAVPRMYQHRILFWGIIGALVMRAILIAVGITLITKFHWIIFIFGGFLIITGIKMGITKDKEVHPENSPVLKLFRRIFPTTEGYEGERFFVRRLGTLMATPLFVVLVMVETTDLVFAVDSIPAILAITTDPFIVYTSNVFAILGLRALFFALAGVVRYFRFLHYGLSAILVFVGAKMVLSDLVHVPIGISLTVISVILAASILASLLIGGGHEPAPESEVVCSDSQDVSGSTDSGSEH